jgi:hypothetical protein
MQSATPKMMMMGRKSSDEERPNWPAGDWPTDQLPTVTEREQEPEADNKAERFGSADEDGPVAQPLAEP